MIDAVDILSDIINRMHAHNYAILDDLKKLDGVIDKKVVDKIKQEHHKQNFGTVLFLLQKELLRLIK